MDPDDTQRRRAAQVHGLPISRHGRITAYDMNKGDIAAGPQRRHAPAIKNHPELGLTIPKTGSPSQAGLPATRRC